MILSNIFDYSVDPNTVSVYIGRLIALDPNFSENGILYIDITDPDSKDLEGGAKTSIKAQASYALVQSYKIWREPPEIKHKTSFDGSMNFTSSGDFHLQNYCFDMKTMAWFTTVSTALNAIGIANIPPVMVSLDTTPFSTKAVAVNVSSSLKEAVNESINNGLKDIKPNTSNSLKGDIKDPEKVKDALIKDRQSNNTRALTRDLSNSVKEYFVNPKTNDPVEKVIWSIVSVLNKIIDIAITPYYDFLSCISLLFQIYEQNINNISELTFPITQFAVIKDDGSVQDPKPLESLAVKTSLSKKIEQFKNEIEIQLGIYRDEIADDIIDKLYQPIAYLFNMIQNAVKSITDPLKEKLISCISEVLKTPLDKITSLIVMLVQPMVSSLPTVVQLVVKLALKKLFKEILGALIEQVIQGLTDALNNLIDSAIQEVVDTLSTLIATAINTLINPLIQKIQEEIIDNAPIIDVSELYNLLVEILNHTREFPQIYVGSNALKPYKSFDEIDWSNPEELSAMLLSLFEEVLKNGGSPQQLSDLKVKELDESIFIDKHGSDSYLYGRILFAIENASTLYIQNGDEPTQSISYDSQTNNQTNNQTNKLLSGTLRSGETSGSLDLGELFYKSFNTKEEFMPYFEKAHEPATRQAKFNDSNIDYLNLDNITPSRWLTNNVPYIDISINDIKGRYICNPYEHEDILVKIDKVHTVKLEPFCIYYSQEVPHIVDDDSKDIEIGNDLIPQYTYNEEKKAYELKPLYIQKKAHSSLSKEETFLYYFNYIKSVRTANDEEIILEPTFSSINDDPYHDEDREYKGGKLLTYTFDEIADKFYKSSKDGKYYAWMVSLLKDKDVESPTQTTPSEETSVDKDNPSVKKMTELLQHAVTALGMEEGFDADSLLSALVGKLLSAFNRVSDAVEGVKPMVESAIEEVDTFDDMGKDIQESLEKLSETVEKVTANLEPAIVATAQAASAAALQSCSMSQSAKDKDFSFTSGDNYDLSTTTEPHSLVPYYNRLKRETLLEPNCKLLVLASGAGTNNLIVVDILS